MGLQHTTARHQVLTLKAHGCEVAIGLESADHISNNIRRDGFYERDLLDDVWKRHPQGHAIDVGAHIGNHTLWFAGVCGMRTTSIEPNVNSFLRLSANIDRNNLPARPLLMAAGAEQARANVEELRQGNSGMSRAVYAEDGDVPVRPLDSLGLTDVALIKIDTEGAELEVLFGAASILATDQPLLYVETDNLRAVEALLGAYGYKCFGEFCKTPTYGFAA